ncbi:phiSA1p31-related protein [Streptomyces sp. PA03-2a]|uniref:phiSA1p31-related protein n=1 Tax=Streptomyces sp. PA03-2a TaxID=3028701 RepID=UPI0029A66D9D|nr:phiSA1p31-related protein [Streptomyces sp. PA03-2a]MDX2732826.1 phiSA1p31-related protein [Streptomyces sp. PA03-2a]
MNAEQWNEPRPVGAPVAAYEYDGTSFDLGIAHQDVFGTEWTWTGTWTEDGQPLMRSETAQPGCSRPVPLPDVYHDHGPLIPIRPRTLPTAAEYRAAVDPNYADTVAAGYVESREAFGARMRASRAQPTPVIPQATGRVLVPSPLEDGGFRRFLKTLRGGA